MSYTYTSAPPPTALPDLSRTLFRLAAPLVIGGLGAAFLHLGQTYIFGHHPESSELFALSVMQPFFFLFIALMEAVAITNQVVSAKSSTDGPHRRAVISSVILSVVVATLVVSIACLFLPLRAYLDFGDSVGGTTALEILPWWFLSLAPFAVFEVFNAGLRGVGRTKQAMLLMLTLVVMNLVTVGVLVQGMSFGIEAIVWANWLVPLVLLLPAVVMLRRAAWQRATPMRPPLPIFLPIMLAAVGGPIFISMISVFISSIVIFPFLTELGPENTSAFLVVMRVRALMVIPAVALGSALAILINQTVERISDADKRRLLMLGLQITAGCYLVFALVGAVVYDWVFERMVADRDVLDVILTIKGPVIATFFAIPIVAALQTLLEQLGRGTLVVLSTIAIELLTVGLLLTMYDSSMGILTIMLIVLLNAAVYLTILLASTVIGTRRLGHFAQVSV